MGRSRSLLTPDSANFPVVHGDEWPPEIGYVMGLRFRRLRRMSSGGDEVSIPEVHLRRPNSEEEEEEEASDSLAELCRPARPLPLKDGYLYVLSGDSLWFRLYVALYPKQLDAYYDISDKLPVITVTFAGCDIRVLDQVKGSTPSEEFYPIELVKKDSPTVCFAADSSAQQQEWANALRSRTQACSLNIEGLNLEGCGNFGGGLAQDAVEKDENVLAQTLELLDDLLKRKSERTKQKKAEESVIRGREELCERDQASITAHQEALRKATHLRQRKISTELKVETLQKQLRKPSKKSQPKAIPELPEGREIVEEQLQELTVKLRMLEGNLGQTEREALEVRREWDKRMEEVYMHLLKSKHLSPDTLKEHWDQSGDTPRILVSKTQDDGRPSGSLRVRAAKLIPSSRTKKKDAGHENNGSMKKSASNNSLNGSARTGYESDDNTRSTDSRDADDFKTLSKSRRGPLKIIGDFLDSHRGRFGSTHRRNKSAEVYTNLDSQECLQKRPRTITDTPISPATETPVSVDTSLATSPSISVTCERSPPAPASREDSPPSDQRQEPVTGKELRRDSGPARDSGNLPEEEVPLMNTDSGGSYCSEDEVRSMDSGPRASSEDADEGSLRKEVDPEIMAEIEAFEKMAQNYLKRHGHEFPF